MDFMLVSAILIFVAISMCLLILIRKQKQRMARYEKRNIKGAARGHLGMFCSKSTVERNRKALLRTNARF